MAPGQYIHDLIGQTGGQLATFGQQWEGARYEVFVRDIVGHYSYHLGHYVVTVLLIKCILDSLDTKITHHHLLFKVHRDNSGF